MIFFDDMDMDTCAMPPPGTRVIFDSVSLQSFHYLIYIFLVSELLLSARFVVR